MFCFKNIIIAIVFTSLFSSVIVIGADSKSPVKNTSPGSKKAVVKKKSIKDIAEKAKKAQKKKVQFGQLTGNVIFGDGEEKVAGVVSLFNKKNGPQPDMGSSRRVPDGIVRLLPDKGFTAKLVPGTYYLGAMKWTRGRKPGPPRPGEEYIFIKDEKGKLRTFDIKVDEIIDVGVLKGSAPDKFADLSNSFVIEGKILGEDNVPFTGAVVLLKRNVNSPRPAFISDPTKEDGRYRFDASPGTYFLFARQSLAMAGRPTPGTYLGTYGETQDVGIGGRKFNNMTKPVTGEVGDIFKDMDITMYELPDPVKKREEVLKKAQAQKIEIGPKNNPLLQKK